MNTMNIQRFIQILDGQVRGEFTNLLYKPCRFAESDIEALATAYSEAEVTIKAKFMALTIIAGCRFISDDAHNLFHYLVSVLENVVPSKLDKQLLLNLVPTNKFTFKSTSNTNPIRELVAQLVIHAMPNCIRTLCHIPVPTIIEIDNILSNYLHSCIGSVVLQLKFQNRRSTTLELAQQVIACQSSNTCLTAEMKKQPRSRDASPVRK